MVWLLGFVRLEFPVAVGDAEVGEGVVAEAIALSRDEVAPDTAEDSGDSAKPTWFTPKRILALTMRRVRPRGGAVVGGGQEVTSS